jgi:hypothetical protein
LEARLSQPCHFKPLNYYDVSYLKEFLNSEAFNDAVIDLIEQNIKSECRKPLKQAKIIITTEKKDEK